jgi:hypothetical protein
MPGVVADYIKQKEYEDGYNYRIYSLAEQYEKDLRMTATDLRHNPSHRLAMVHNLAIKSSDSIRNEVGDRGAGYERINSWEYDHGQRKAIFIWSHARNQEIKEQIREAEAAVRIRLAI